MVRCGARGSFHFTASLGDWAGRGIALASCYTSSNLHTCTAKSNYTTTRHATRHTSIAKMDTREVSSPDDLKSGLSYQELADEAFAEVLADLPPLDNGFDITPRPPPALPWVRLSAPERNGSINNGFANVVTQEVSSSDYTGTHDSQQARAGEAFDCFLPLGYGVDSAPRPPPAAASGRPCS